MPAERKEAVRAGFVLGQRVEKIGGRYGGPGRIVGWTIDLDEGYRLYNVAMKVEGGYGEFVHVFPANVLRPLNDTKESGK